MSNILCTRCDNNLSATHALCDLDLVATDWEGNKISEPDYVFCDRCSQVLVEEEDAEKCIVCETFDSNKVTIDDVDFKPLYLPESLNEIGRCKDH